MAGLNAALKTAISHAAEKHRAKKKSKGIKAKGVDSEQEETRKMGKVHGSEGKIKPKTKGEDEEYQESYNKNKGGKKGKF